MVSLTDVRASNTQLKISTTPRVALFVGATAGIGKAALQHLVRTGFPIKAYIVGRDEGTFKPVLNELRNSNKAAELIFLQGQISLMAEAKRITDEIMQREDRLDLIFLSAGYLPFLGRQETSEGVEAAFAVAYYSRQIFIKRLIPLLRASLALKTDSYMPRVVNVLGTGTETENLFLKDLTLKQPGHFTVPNFMGHMGSMTSSSLKRAAEKPENQEIVVIHHHPGFVSTELLRKSWGDKWDEKQPLPPLSGELVQSTPDESGERSLYVMTSAKYGGRGVPLPDEQKEGLTVKGLVKGSLFCVGDNLETLKIGNILDSLEKSGAASAISDNSDELIGQYL